MNRIAVIIASVGRPAEIERWLDHVQRQTRKPDTLILSVSNPATDLPPEDRLPKEVVVCVCRPGLPIQRNAGLSTAVDSHDIVAYFDDDYVPSRYCIEGVERLFDANPDIVGATGVLWADGINTPGIGYEEATEIVAKHDALPQDPIKILREIPGLYGCNMVYRTKAVAQERFDEELPLYGWQEDIDFSARLARKGRLVTSNAFCGVHQGVKGGRISGVRLGYSQLANPMYLVRKGTMLPGYAAKLMIKSFLINHAKMFRPEPWIDRAGRAKGNWLAILDAVRGKDHPKNILMMRKQ